MATSNMRGRSLSILGIFAAVAGTILILCFNSIRVTGVTIAAGILFVGVGLVNLLFYSSISKGENAIGRVLTLIANASAIVLGISMLVFQQTFVPLIAFMFGLLVAVSSIWQFFALAIGTRPYQLPAWLYIFPILIAAASVYIFIKCQSPGSDHMLMLVSGIALAILGIGCVIEGSILGMARRADRQRLENDARDNHIEDVQHQVTEVQTSNLEPSISTDQAQVPASAITQFSPKKTIETTDDLDDEIIESNSH